MKRTFVLALSLTLLLLITVSSAAASNPQLLPSVNDPLRFPTGNYVVRTVKVSLPWSVTTVTFKHYHHIPYVSNPVPDYNYMEVLVPIKINGTYIDSSNAPILLNIMVGGYMSVKNTLGGQNGVPLGDVSIAVDPLTGFASRVGSVERAALALVSGFVVVIPGVRGSDCVLPGGTFCGKAPAHIVDLKAVVRYMRYNSGSFPGDEERIIATGVSAGGALAALLATSSGHPWYEPYLQELGAAKASDLIYAAAPFCPITDLEHDDIMYEWEFGKKPMPNGELVNQTLSGALAAMFPNYLESLQLRGKNGQKLTTVENYVKYVVEEYLAPAATEYILALPEPYRTWYLGNNTWIGWDGSRVRFTWEDYVTYGIGRMKGVPAFDGLFDPTILKTINISALQSPFQLMSLGITPENMLFGNGTVFARHFTDFTIRIITGNPEAIVGDIYPDLPVKIRMMNPMYFITQGWPNTAEYWRIRTGSKDPHASIFLWTNLAIALENAGKEVDFALYWGGDHGADYDPWNLMKWIKEITGYEIRAVGEETLKTVTVTKAESTVTAVVPSIATVTTTATKTQTTTAMTTHTITSVATKTLTTTETKTSVTTLTTTTTVGVEKVVEVTPAWVWAAMIAVIVAAVVPAYLIARRK